MRPNWTKACLSGFVGTVVITLMMYVVSPWLTGGPMDIAEMLGTLMGTSWATGLIAHFVIGTLVLPTIYTLVLFRMFWGSPSVRGMTFGLILWLMSQVVVLPLVGAGFFSAEAGGGLAVAGSLIGHLLYGLVLGSLAGPSRRVVYHQPVLRTERGVRVG